MSEQNKASGKGYNMNLKVLSVETPTNSKGEEYIRAKVEGKIRGEMRPRTLIAQGKAADAVRDILIAGEEAKVRVLFEKVVNDAGEEGGEYLVAIGVPLPPKQKAA